MHNNSTNIVNAANPAASSKIDTVIIDYSFYSLIIIINVNYNLFNLIYKTHFSSCILVNARFDFENSMSLMAFAAAPLAFVYVSVCVIVAVTVIFSY
jgi:hypothetical protein